MLELSICLMLKSPQSGTVKTRLGVSTGYDDACVIYRKLVEHQLAQISRSKVEIHYSPASATLEMQSWLGASRTYIAQAEGDLGDRFRRAVKSVFARGGQAALLLGSDCPDVTAEVIESTRTQLETHDVVIGPAQDGGYYLLAVKACHPRLFEGVAWSTAQVFPQTMARIKELGLSCHVLPELADVDDIASLAQARLAHPFLR